MTTVSERGREERVREEREERGREEIEEREHEFCYSICGHLTMNIGN